MMRRVLACLAISALPAAAATISGHVRDQAGAVLPGVTVEVAKVVAISDPSGAWHANVAPGTYDVTFRLLNFSTVVRRGIVARDERPTVVDAQLTVAASASIVVTDKKTFRNLADLDEPVNGMIGVADAASVGVVTARQLDARPMQRAGDVLESVPGVIISQHSGEGKANQYYLRGFNLDHGTDLALSVAGAPVNMPTHAHGQGYSDANLLIPELISGVQYKKGPYYADEGDFASAGAVNINYVNVLQHPIASLTGGSFGYRRALFADSHTLAHGVVLGALELSRSDGPWVHPDGYDKINALLRYTGGDASRAYSVTLSVYDGRWSSSDQIPDRAIREGLSQYGEIDATDGGKSHRYSAVAEWQSGSERALTKASAYAIGYGLDLFSDFTYFLDDPVHGDQFEQRDERIVLGGRTTHQTTGTFFGRPAETLLGFDVRHDHIGALGLYHTRDRQRLDTIRSDRVFQTSGGLFAQTSVQWSEKVRAVAGLRGDAYEFDVSGTKANAALLSPKLNLIFGPWRGTELYVSAGNGFHSNDGRGTVAAVDRVTPLARTTGAEIGLRAVGIPRLQSTIAVWGLDISSELVFAGDAGMTEPSRSSRRTGIEWSNYYRLTDHLVADADLAYSRARFRDGAPENDRVPGAVEGVLSAGVSLYDLGRFTGGLRYRYLGPRPLVENNAVRSEASHLVNADVRFALTPRLRIGIEALNLGNARVSDIDYFYRSRLPGEPLAGVDDVHTHPVEPRAIRVRLETTF
jgi:hypothetical protein